MNSFNTTLLKLNSSYHTRFTCILFENKYYYKVLMHYLRTEKDIFFASDEPAHRITRISLPPNSEEFSINAIDTVLCS